MSEIMLGLHTKTFGTRESLLHEITPETLPFVDNIKLFPHEIIKNRLYGIEKDGTEICLDDPRSMRGHRNRFEQIKTKRQLMPFTVAIKTARVFAPKTLKVTLDTRLALDSVHDLDEELGSIFETIATSDNPELASPDYMIIHYSSTRNVLGRFVELCNKNDISPICFTSSSRSEVSDFDDLPYTPEEYASVSTKVVGDLGFAGMMLAAADCEIAKSVNPNLLTFATGARTEYTVGSHPRGMNAADVAQYADIFVASHSVLNSENPLLAVKSLKQI